MTECCLALVANYETAWQTQPTDGTALICRACGTKLVFTNGKWVEE